MNVPRKVAIVPHTHWDREWYAPFQTFRLRLVDVLDSLLPRLETDPAFTHFLFDGQMAMVDDYLAVRPEAEPVLRRLAAAGRISLGPWYVLMDEFLVSGETIVRNLQLGLQRAAAFGGAMPVGYLPDMFGHVAQMPQLLRLAGLEHAVVWRGVPAAVDRTAFWWSAPDGSTVRAEYLPYGYGNGQQVPADADVLVRRLQAHTDELGSMPLDGILFMNGTDHEEPQPWLGRVVAEANARQDDFALAVTSLPAYLAAAAVDGLPAWTGELRSGARANLLMGVASNRVDVRQAAARAERALERLAEPLSALFLPAERWPGTLLAEAWLHVIRNSAHDSVCACSADEVVDAVGHRYAEARQIADGLTDRALAGIGQSLAEPGVVIVNPSARTRHGVVELLLPDDVTVEGGQVDPTPLDVLPPDERPRRRVLVHAAGVPGFGWQTWAPPSLPVPPVTAGALVLDNGLVHVAVDPDVGTFALDGHPGLDRLVDDGDAGDTYNYSPPAGDVLVDTPTAVAVRPVETGPLRARLEVVRTFVWPDHLDADGHRTGEQTVVVTTLLELRTGEDVVRVTTSFDNRCRDHRLRAWFPLPRPATTSVAECAFATVERGLDAEGGHGEHALPTFPSRRFVQAGGLTLVHEGLAEYELVGQGRALALTLLRATGMLSRGPMAYRSEPAGPLVPLEGPQLQRPLTLRYAVHAGDGDPYALADDVLVPLLATTAPGGGNRPPSGSALDVQGAEVSAIRRQPGGLEVRLFNPHPEPATVTVAGRWGWRVDLRGHPLELVDGAVELAPWQIATLLLHDDMAAGTRVLRTTPAACGGAPTPPR